MLSVTVNFAIDGTEHSEYFNGVNTTEVLDKLYDKYKDQDIRIRSYTNLVNTNIHLQE